MDLTVLSVAFPLAPVGADAAGGAEQVLWSIDRALVGAGQRSIVIGCEGSRVTGELVETPRVHEGSESARVRGQRAVRDAIAHVIANEAVDLVHMHGLDFNAYLPPPGPPVLATLHLPPSWSSAGALQPDRPGTYLNCVSSSQRRQVPPAAPVLATVPNGVDVDVFSRSADRVAPRTYALWLGRVCPEKGVHLALDAARIADVPLLVAGPIFGYPAHQQYYREQVAPRLDGCRRYVGPAGLAAKRRLLAGARCLLVPSLAPETSSLVAMEAIASGTPVIAFPSGALSEIVDHGLTGYLVRSVEEMAAAIPLARALDREHCREVARARFSEQQMIARYFRLYEALVGRVRMHAVPAPELESCCQSVPP